MILIQRYLTICKSFLVKKKEILKRIVPSRKPRRILFHITRAHPRNRFPSRAIHPILSPTPTNHFNFPSRASGFGENVNIPVDRSGRRCTKRYNIYIGTHALLKNEGPWRRAPVTRNCGEIHEPDGISPDSWLLA